MNTISKKNNFNHFFQQINYQYNKIGFNIFCLLFFTFLFFFFHRQSFNPSSDFFFHINKTFISPENDTIGYSLLHHLIFSISYLLKFLISMNTYELNRILMAIVCSGSTVLALYVTNKQLRKNHPDQKPIFLNFVAISTFLVAMIIVPFSDSPYMLGKGSPNVWHNPTFLISRPFSILVFFYVVDFIGQLLNNNVKTKSILLIVIFATLSAWAKPSFLLSFAPCFGIVLSAFFIAKKISFKDLALSSLIFIPAFLYVYVLYHFFFGSSESSNSVIVSFASCWSSFSRNIPFDILLGMAFPFFVFINNIKSSTLGFKIAFVNYVVASGVFLTFAEDGDRFRHGNFGWTYFFGMFFMYLYALECFFLNLRKQYLYLSIGIVLFLLSLLSGAYYILQISNGLRW